ncbi:threonine/serine dehydratase [Steroidobacter sp.]|uniref:threonine ammonia-lyase n=1 Tax=Steroidobacter sp. TaxID=1978227 RepID=UPI001A62843D|nr:pyridoxal-phosphate dependent enzyme [Steroidobacter sp.]MBL8268327.1 pyridoxal-phosphate dependent enzyme [Steroidobacter sp.]
MSTLTPPHRSEVEAARERIADFAIRTPLVRLNCDAPRPIYLKLEMLQPIGSFKIRCAANALLAQSEEIRATGVVTASAGNFAQGLGYVASRLGIRVKSLVPDSAAESKLQALERLGVTVERIPYRQWWSILENPTAQGYGAGFIHPCADSAVLAGNATIALEILEEIEPAEVLVPYGGGGLLTGIAATLKSELPNAKAYGVESTAGTPLAAAFAAGNPVPVAFDNKTFITGMGSPQVLAPIWPLIRTWVDGALCVELAEVASAIRLLIKRHHLIAEGAGAVPVAAALARTEGDGPIVCVLSGGHLDTSHLLQILQEKL